MENKWSGILLLTAAVIAFAFVSVLVLISGRNSFFVKKKLQIGAFLLSLGWFSAGCYPTEVSCYAGIASDQIILNETMAQSGYVVAQGDTLDGEIHYREFDSFFYEIVDSSWQQVTKAPLNPLDGAMDSSKERFHIILNDTIHPGWYTLRFSAEVDTTKSVQLQDFILTVVEKIK